MEIILQKRIGKNGKPYYTVGDHLVSIIDTETTGFSSSKNKVIQFTMKLLGNPKILDVRLKHKDYGWNDKTLEFHKKISPDILQIIEKEGLPFQNNYISFREKLKEFWDSLDINPELLRKKVLFVAYNSTFDFRMSTQSWGSDENNRMISDLLPNKQLDVYNNIVRKNFSELKRKGIIENLKLETIYNFLLKENKLIKTASLKKHKEAFHDSKFDVLATEAVLISLLPREK